MNLQTFLASDDVIDWKEPSVFEKAAALASSRDLYNEEDLIRSTFEWVRDKIPHSLDHHLNPVTCSASEVLRGKTGICFAKAHLLAALLRANGIPAGLCYQRMSVERQGKRFYLHGLCAVYLPKIGWYRLDPRGQKQGVDARCTPPVECMAYVPQDNGERDYKGVFAKPLPPVMDLLRHCETWNDILVKIPDLGDGDLPQTGESREF